MKTLPRDLREPLEFIDISQDVDAASLPTFLIAGPQRTGSTWIYTQIEDHPQIQLTNPKEVYFFNLLRKHDHPQHETDDLCQYLKHLELTPEQVAEREHRCQELYGRSFDPIARGDATASYAAGIDEARMVDLLRLIPDLRVIITVRNPIERAWSHAKLIVERERGKGSMANESLEEIEKILRWDYNLSCGLYTEMHDRWSRHLKPGHLLFRSFDEIVSRPVDFLQDVLRFLGVDHDASLLQRDPMAGSNPTKSGPRYPERIATLLRDQYEEEITRLRERFGIGMDWTLPS